MNTVGGKFATAGVRWGLLAPPCRVHGLHAKAVRGMGSSTVFSPKNHRIVSTGASADDASRQSVSADLPGDAFRKAGGRLQNLVANVGDGEEELLNNMLDEEPANSKVLLSAIAGGIVVSVCSVVCVLCGNDPAGGAHLSIDSLGAGFIGLAACLPMVILRRGLWSPAARQQFPVLEEYTRRQAEYLRPMISGLSSPQQMVVLCSEVMSMLVLMLPTLMGCIKSSLGLYSRLLEENMGLLVPQSIPSAVAVIVASVLSGIGKAGIYSVTEDEWSIVEDAIKNADRYYRVVSMAEGASGDPSKDAQAFKVVASNWLEQNQNASRLAAILGIFDMLTMGLLWEATGDLTAPAVVALMCAAVEYDCVQKHFERN